MTYFLFRVQGSGGGFAAKKEANPASLRSAAPSKGRGSRGYSLLPLEGGAPKGRRLEGESGIPDTQPSPRGEGAPKGRIGHWRHERERGGSSQVGDIREHPSAAASPMGKVKRRRLRRKKGSQPRLAALSSPFQGKGLAWMLPPSFGRRCPEGAEVGGGKRYPRHTAFPSRGRCPEGADRVLAV